MADSQINALPLKAIPELTDLMPIDDMSVSPIITKKISLASFLVAFNLKQGYSDSAIVAEGVTKVFIFPAALGTAVDGSDYGLGSLFCMDSLNGTEKIGYGISNRTQNGFEITPTANAFISFTAILI